jgi:hypothetical protein
MASRYAIATIDAIIAIIVGTNDTGVITAHATIVTLSGLFAGIITVA